MDSSILEQFGFKEWHSMRHLSGSKIPVLNGVYVIKLNKQFGRLKGTSDILYIGSTGDLNQRIIVNYIQGSGGETTQRIHEYLFVKNYIEAVEISWVLTNEQAQLERKLKTQYDEEHHELPPWNRAG